MLSKSSSVMCSSVVSKSFFIDLGVDFADDVETDMPMEECVVECS